MKEKAAVPEKCCKRCGKSHRDEVLKVMNRLGPAGVIRKLASIAGVLTMRDALNKRTGKVEQGIFVRLDEPEDPIEVLFPIGFMLSTDMPLSEQIGGVPNGADDVELPDGTMFVNGPTEAM